MLRFWELGCEHLWHAVTLSIASFEMPLWRWDQRKERAREGVGRAARGSCPCDPCAGEGERWGSLQDGFQVFLRKCRPDQWRLLESKLPGRGIRGLSGMGHCLGIPARLNPQLEQLVGSAASGQTWRPSQSAAAGTNSPDAGDT